MITSLHFLMILSTLIFLGTLGLNGLKILIHPQWMETLEPTLTRLLKTWSVVAILFVGCIPFFHQIYPWAQEAMTPGSFRGFCLTVPSFALRGLIYLLIFGGLSLQIARKRKVPGPFVLLTFLFGGSLAIFEWVLSLEPHWHSTMFALDLLLCGTLLSYNLCLSSLKMKPNEERLNDLNTIQLTLIAFWTYLSFIQFLTIWSAHLPDEVSFYLRRIEGRAVWIPLGLGIFQSLLPISLLLFRSLKKSFTFTQVLSRATLCFQVLYLFWLVRYS